MVTRSHWFEPLARHLGAGYLRYSFTKGTAQEVKFLRQVLNLEAGSRILDVGCGPGRHARLLAEEGFRVVGIDRSEDFLVLASRLDPSGAYFVRADASALPFQDAFDAAISLCCGGFGLSRSALHAEDASLPLPSPDPDEQILRSIAGALVPGGCLALTAFSAYFQVRYLDAGDQFDPASGMNRETTVLLDAEGSEKRAELFTTCFTPRELCLLSERAGLTPLHVWSVGPGEYARRPPDLQHPELLLIARRV